MPLIRSKFNAINVSKTEKNTQDNIITKGGEKTPPWMVRSYETDTCLDATGTVVSHILSLKEFSQIPFSHISMPGYKSSFYRKQLLLGGGCVRAKRTPPPPVLLWTQSSSQVPSEWLCENHIHSAPIEQYTSVMMMMITWTKLISISLWTPAPNMAPMIVAPWPLL